MADIETAAWSETAASNIQPSPDGWPPNSSPNIVYTTDREMMGAIKRDFNRRNATVTSGGSANAQTLSYTQGPTAYIRGQQFTFIAGFGNTGPLTVAVGGLAATAVQSQGVALTGGEIKAGQIVELMFDGTQFQIISGQGTFLPVSGPGLAGGTMGGLYNDVGRNKLHNAMFRIQQRGTGPWTTTGSYMADRWSLSLNLDTSSVSIGTMGDAGRAQIGDDEANFILACTVAGNVGAASFTQFLQRVEDVRRLANKTITISFYTGATAALNIGVYVQQYFGTGGSPSAGVNVGTQTVTTGTTWKRVSVMFTMPTIQGKTLGTNNDHYSVILFALSSGSTNSALMGVGVQSGTIWFWGMQLEIGSVATPLEKIDYALDWQECSRFYWVGGFNFLHYGTAGLTWTQTLTLPTVMRATPIYTSNFTTQSNCSGSAVAANAQAGARGYNISTTVTAAAAFQVAGTFSASADL